MQIHLSKPGGRREGPFTLERINTDLASGKYSGSDYWAWHDGLPEWVPLHSVPGIHDGGQAKASDPATAPSDATPSGSTTLPHLDTRPSTAGSVPARDDSKLSSGLPFRALEQIFILTAGDGPTASRSAVTRSMLEKITGAHLDTIRENVARDVIAHCNILDGLKGESSSPGSVWVAMATFKPELMERVREGQYRICVRTFSIEDQNLVSLFLFYNKAKENAAASDSMAQG
jgi:uncharacterized protein DUF4339